MTEITRNFRIPAERPGLHCVWVSLHNDGKAPLISIWKRDQMGAFEAQNSQDGAVSSSVGDEGRAEEPEESLPCIHAVGTSPRAYRRTNPRTFRRNRQPAGPKSRGENLIAVKKKAVMILLAMVCIICAAAYLM